MTLWSLLQVGLPCRNPAVRSCHSAAPARTSRPFGSDPRPRLPSLQTAILLVNGVAVLNDERFLNKHGLSFSGPQPGSGGFGPPDQGGLKQQIAGFVHAVQYLRVPLIAVNIVVMLVKLVFG
ncbi:unnamed protein product [Pedinophyceae sp. YPF-701]|nr:unnamed protein product [Pedinophyceae sp. YPF-701]